MGDRVRAGKPALFVNSHGLLSLLPSAGRKMSTGQSAVQVWLISLVDKCVGGR